jgi:hypothetical protein
MGGNPFLERYARIATLLIAVRLTDANSTLLMLTALILLGLDAWSF